MEAIVNARFKTCSGGAVSCIVGMLLIILTFSYAHVDQNTGALIGALVGGGCSIIAGVSLCCYSVRTINESPQAMPIVSNRLEPIIEVEEEPGAGLNISVIKHIEIEGKEEQEIEPGSPVSSVVYVQSSQNIMKL